MPVRVELTNDAVADLDAYAETGNLRLFLCKLVRLEEVGSDAGLPLGKGLAGFRKIVVGDRNWRIIFTMDAEETVATVWVIGERNDSACYEDAQRRIRALAKSQPQAPSLAAVLFRLTETQGTVRKAKRRRR